MENESFNVVEVRGPAESLALFGARHPWLNAGGSGTDHAGLWEKEKDGTTTLVYRGSSKAPPSERCAALSKESKGCSVALRWIGGDLLSDGAEIWSGGKSAGKVEASEEAREAARSGDFEMEKSFEILHESLALRLREKAPKLFEKPEAQDEAGAAFFAALLADDPEAALAAFPGSKASKEAEAAVWAAVFDAARCHEAFGPSEASSRLAPLAQQRLPAGTVGGGKVLRARFEAGAFGKKAPDWLRDKLLSAFHEVPEQARAIVGELFSTEKSSAGFLDCPVAKELFGRCLTGPWWTGESWRKVSALVAAGAAARGRSDLAGAWLLELAEKEMGASASNSKRATFDALAAGCARFVDARSRERLLASGLLAGEGLAAMEEMDMEPDEPIEGGRAPAPGGF